MRQRPRRRRPARRRRAPRRTPTPARRRPLCSSAQVAAAITGPGGVGDASIWVDGLPVNDIHVARTAKNATVYANFDPALAAGRHTVVAFATVGRDAGATAWAFDALKPKA